MGGAIARTAMGRAVRGDRWRAIVRVSHEVDWLDVLRFPGRARHVPGLISDPAFATSSHSWGKAITGQEKPLDLQRLDFVERADEVTVTVLILHSDDDGYEPSTGSRELAEARTDLATFVQFSICLL